MSHLFSHIKKRPYLIKSNIQREQDDNRGAYLRFDLLHHLSAAHPAVPAINTRKYIENVIPVFTFKEERLCYREKHTMRAG